jgi:hypothetical protein
LKATQGCEGIFLNTFSSMKGIHSEGQQENVVLKACEKVGEEIVVEPTSPYIGHKEMWDNAASQKLLEIYYSSKHNAEEAVRGAGLKTYTILQPAFIHHNYTLPLAH